MLEVCVQFFCFVLIFFPGNTEALQILSFILLGTVCQKLLGAGKLKMWETASSNLATVCCLVNVFVKIVNEWNLQVLA